MDDRYVTVSEKEPETVTVDKQSSEPVLNTSTPDYDYGRNQEPLDGPIAVRGISSSLSYGLATDSSTQTVSATTTADGTLGTFTLSGVTSTTNALVAPATGVYYISGGARWSSGSDGNLRGASITASGNFISPLQDIRPILSANDLYENVSGVASLTAGDTVKLRVYNGDSSSASCIYRRLSIVKIS
jgi:hypothetical protein